MFPDTSQIVDWDPNQYQMENESNKRPREKEHWSEANSFAYNYPQALQAPHTQTLPPVFASEITGTVENSNPRHQKRPRRGSPSTGPILELEQAVALTSQHYGTYDYSQGLSSAGTTIGAPYHQTPCNLGMVSISHDRGSNDQYRTNYDTSIPTGPAQNKTFALQGAHNFTVRDQAHIMNVGTINSVNHHNQLFDIMERCMEKYVSLNATHDSPVQDPDRVCHPETRRNVLKQIGDWTDNPDGSENIFWLHGPAGAGKSAIAQTIARSYDREKVAATFFFFRSDSSRNDGNKLFTTIAWQLAFAIPGLKTHIIDSLNERPDVPRKDIETQFQELIVRPLQGLISASSPTRLSTRIVIIDGVDECANEKLQRRFLTIIGNAVNDPDFPLRFLICSRPEAHIEEAIDSFQCPPCRLDLAKLNDARDEIDRYLRTEFSRIALEQNLGPTWPGEERIQECVRKSWGSFAYASTLIKILDDEYSSATEQLDIVLGLKPHCGKSLFAELDALYMEILNRQRDWAFLNDILSILTVSEYSDITICTFLMDISETESLRKMRGMRSLLRLHSDGNATFHHQSFLDFLQDPSRSGQYHISPQAGERRCLDLLTASIIRHAPKAIEQPDYCYEDSFFFHFWLNHNIPLSVEEFEQALQPLVDIYAKLPRIESASWQEQYQQWSFFSTICNHLLNLTVRKETSKYRAATPNALTVEQGLIEHPGTLGPQTPLVAAEVEQTVFEKSDLDNCLASVLDHLRETKLEFPPSAMIINLMCSLLEFDYVETAMRVRSIPDGQLLVDFIDYLINNEEVLNRHSTAIAHKAARFALEIHERVPVLPRSLFYKPLRPVEFVYEPLLSYFEFTSMFIGRILDRNYILRVSCIHEEGCFMVVQDSANVYDLIVDWRKSNPSPIILLRVMLEVAKAFQYLDSMNIQLDYDIISYIYLDSECHVKIFPMFEVFLNVDDRKYQNTFVLGTTFDKLYFNVPYLGPWNLKRQSEPEISDELWQVIQRCCAEDPESRPTIEEVVQEMESWKLDL